MSDERSREFESFDEPASNLPLLDKLDRVIAALPPGDPIRRDLLDLRPHVSDQSQMIGEARHMIEKLEEVIKKVTSPANRIGTFLEIGERAAVGTIPTTDRPKRLIPLLAVRADTTYGAVVFANPT